MHGCVFHTHTCFSFANASLLVSFLVFSVLEEEADIFCLHTKSRLGLIFFLPK